MISFVAPSCVLFEIRLTFLAVSYTVRRISTVAGRHPAAPCIASMMAAATSDVYSTKFLALPISVHVPTTQLLLSTLILETPYPRIRTPL